MRSSANWDLLCPLWTNWLTDSMTSLNWGCSRISPCILVSCKSNLSWAPCTFPMRWVGKKLNEKVKVDSIRGLPDPLRRRPCDRTGPPKPLWWVKWPGQCPYANCGGDMWRCTLLGWGVWIACPTSTFYQCRPMREPWNGGWGWLVQQLTPVLEEGAFQSGARVSPHWEIHPHFWWGVGENAIPEFCERDL